MFLQVKEGQKIMRYFKKMAAFMAGIACLAMIGTGCGNSTGGNGAENTTVEAETEADELLSRGEYKASDYCTIKQYKGLVIKKADVEPSAEDIQKQVDAMMESAKTLKPIKKDRAVKKGDVVNIDYAGYRDGVAFEGGTDTGYDLEIGGGRFIAGFEDGLIGAKKGEKRDLNLTFPDPYPNNPDLAGKEVVFKVTVNEIKAYSTPKYTDELVAANTEYKTIKEYEQSIRDDIYEDNVTRAMSDQLFSNVEFAEEFPESLTAYYRSYYLKSYTQMLNSYYGMDLKTYLESAGMDEDTFVEEELGSMIQNSCEGDILLGTIAEAENIQAEGEAYDQYIADLAEKYSLTTEEVVEKVGEEEVKFAFITNQAYDLIRNSVVVE